jgi:hypothetical protein
LPSTDADWKIATLGELDTAHEPPDCNEYNHNVEQNPPHHGSNAPKTAVARDSFPLAFVERHKQLNGEQADYRIAW